MICYHQNQIRRTLGLTMKIDFTIPLLSLLLIDIYLTIQTHIPSIVYDLGALGVE